MYNKKNIVRSRMTDFDLAQANDTALRLAIATVYVTTTSVSLRVVSLLRWKLDKADLYIKAD